MSGVTINKFDSWEKSVIDEFYLQSEEIKFLHSNTPKSIDYLKVALGENTDKEVQKLFHKVIVDKLCLDYFLASHFNKSGRSSREHLQIFFADCIRQTWGMENGMLFKKASILEFLKELFNQYFKFIENNPNLILSILESYEQLEKCTGFSPTLTEKKFIEILIDASDLERKINFENFFEEHPPESHPYTFRIPFVQQVVLHSRLGQLMPKLLANNPELVGKEDALAAMPRIAILNVMMVVNQLLPNFPLIYTFNIPSFNSASDLTYLIKPDLNGIRIEQKMWARKKEGPCFRNVFEANALVPRQKQNKEVRYEYCQGLVFGKDTTDAEVISFTKTFLSSGEVEYVRK